MANNLKELVEFEEVKLQSAGAERNLLACLLKSEEALMRLPANFTSDAISHPLNRELFRVVDGTYGSGHVPDPVTIYRELPKSLQSDLEELGGYKYLQTLEQYPIDPRNAGREAETLTRLHTLRKVKEAGKQIEKIPETQPDPSRAMAEVEEVVGSIEHQTEEVVQIGSQGTDFIQDRMANAAEIPGVPSGYEALDRHTSGFQPGGLYIIAARTGIGKSMTMLNWAKYIAVDQQIPTLWISTEHDLDEEYARLLALSSGVFFMQINKGTFKEVPDYVDRVQQAHETIARSPLFFCNMPNFTLDKIKRMARKYVRVHGIRVVFFDFLKPPENNGSSVAEWQELGTFAYGLKALASTEKVPVVTAVQINRDGSRAWREASKGKAGEEQDVDFIAASDRIAHAANVVMMLRRPYEQEEPNAHTARVLEIRKNRHGSTNYKWLLNFRAEIDRITEAREI